MKTISTKILFLSVIFFLLINCFSCKKSGTGTFPTSPTTPNSEYYFECKINGELKTFNYSLKTVRYLSFEKKEIGIVGYSEPLSNVQTPFLGIQIGHIQDNIILIPGTFTTITNNGYFLVDYVSPTFHYGSFSNLYFTVTITELDDIYIKGTFSGNLRDRISGATITVTEGKFYVPHCKINC